MMSESDFDWIPFYSEFAKRLLSYKDRDKRRQLINDIREELSNTDSCKKLDQGNLKNLSDIDPFSIFSLFNGTNGNSERIKIGNILGHIIELDSQYELPNNCEFLGVPTIPLSDPGEKFFFASKNSEFENHPEWFDCLWGLFEVASKLIDSNFENQSYITDFKEKFDAALNIPKIGSQKLSMGLFWAYPEHFPPLDSKTRVYIKKYILIDKLISKDIDSAKYLEVRKDLIKIRDIVPHKFCSFSHLSYLAWSGKEPVECSGKYNCTDIIEDGCFVPIERLEESLEAWKSKKNMILQGPPGTGKTWLARRLAFTLIGSRSNDKIISVQFHPNMSYEDFVRGYRPGKDGKLESVDGIFIEVAEQARRYNKNKYVIIIEEINRGNPAMIFGELLTLIEEDKRSSEHAIKLTYPDEDGKKEFFVPENLYVIGTMNIADRSLALVDLALRRRFAFVDLKPELGETWFEWLTEKCNVDKKIAKDIQNRMKILNESISDSQFLGKQYQIGHSYVTPMPSAILSDQEDAMNWFRQITETEILPLLKEYWYDSPEELVRAWKDFTKESDVFPKGFFKELDVHSRGF